MRTDQRGFGLIEAMIGATLTAIVMMGLSKTLQLSFRGQKRFDVKNEVQSLSLRLRNLVSEGETCKGVLVDQLAPDSLIFDPANLDAYNSDPVKSEARLALGGGTPLAAQSKMQGFQIKSLSLRILGEILPAGSGRYEGALRFETNSRDSQNREIAGGEIAPQQIPLILQTEKVGDQRKIVACAGHTLAGGEMCESIGGRWIRSLNRCYFGGDLKLNQHEGVGPEEFEDGGALEGASVEECYFKHGSRMLTYKCYNSPGRRIPDCNFASHGSIQNRDGWNISLLNPDRSLRRFIRACDGGVRIKVPDEKSRYLDDNEYIDDNYVGGDTPPGKTSFPGSLTKNEFIKNYDILDTVSECFYDEEPGANQSMRSFKCNQEEKASVGGVGSCVFINHGLAWGPPYRYMWASWTPYKNYTGWIYVTNARTLKPVAGGSTIVREAVGRKCFIVKRQTGAEAPLNAAIAHNTVTESGTPNVLDTEDRYKDVSECLFIGGAPPSPTTVLSDPLPVDDTVGPYQGQYLQHYRCDSKAMGDIDKDNLTGVTSTDPSLNKGSCWYFSDVMIAKNYKNVSGVVNEKYTGWMYLPRDLPDQKFNVELAGTAATPLFSVIPKVAGFRISAIPCNAGVRLNPAN